MPAEYLRLRGDDGGWSNALFSCISLRKPAGKKLFLWRLLCVCRSWSGAWFNDHCVDRCKNLQRSLLLSLWCGLIYSAGLNMIAIRETGLPYSRFCARHHRSAVCGRWILSEYSCQSTTMPVSKSLQVDFTLRALTTGNRREEGYFFGAFNGGIEAGVDLVYGGAD